MPPAPVESPVSIAASQAAEAGLATGWSGGPQLLFETNTLEAFRVMASASFASVVEGGVSRLYE